MGVLLRVRPLAVCNCLIYASLHVCAASARTLLGLHAGQGAMPGSLASVLATPQELLVKHKICQRASCCMHVTCPAVPRGGS